jgi:hypothetical protein
LKLIIKKRREIQKIQKVGNIGRKPRQIPTINPQFQQKKDTNNKQVTTIAKLAHD